MGGTPHYGTQTKARKAALDVLFAAELRGIGFVEMFDERRNLDDVVFRGLTTRIVLGVAEHQGEIDARLAALVSDSWSVQRMPAVDRNLARMALFELDYTDTPGPVVIAEAVRLASDLSTDESPSFLNGLLAKALTTRKPPTDA